MSFLFTAIGFEKLTGKTNAISTPGSNSDYLPDIPSTPYKRKTAAVQKEEYCVKKIKKSDPKVTIKLSVQKDECDDVIYIKECNTDCVKQEVKIGASPGIPICITEDNVGILPSNAIIID